MNMIEKVARVLAIEDNISNPDTLIGIGLPLLISGGFLIPENVCPAWYKYINKAKAAIAAMREPSEGMLLAGKDDRHINEYRIWLA